VRAAAIKNITDITVLETIAQKESNRQVRELAVKIINTSL
jgi:hypothetical protein